MQTPSLPGNKESNRVNKLANYDTTNCPELLLQHEEKGTTKAILQISTAMSIQQHHLLSGSSAPSPALGTIRKFSLYRGRRMTVPVELQNISG
jgi:hypothetical protein